MDVTDAPLDVAVVGVGRMGRHHARVYAGLGGVRLVAVVDEDEERAATLADEHGCEALTSVQALLERCPGVRAATVAVPTRHHAAAALPLLEHGIACLVEKPLAGDAAEARRIADAAARHGAVLQVGHTERFNPAVRAVGKLAVAPRFVEVHRVSPMTFRSLDVGVVMDMMIHDLDLVLLFAASPLERVDAAGVAVIGTHEDVANARLVFASGCVANLTASRLALKTERKMRLFSEQAYVSLDYHQRRGVIIRRSDNDEALRLVREQVARGADLTDLDYSQLVNVDEVDMDDGEAGDALTAQLGAFVASVRDGAPVAVDGVAGCAAVDAAARVVEAIRRHRWHGLGDVFPPSAEAAGA